MAKTKENKELSNSLSENGTTKQERLSVLKTYKIFIGGAFPRTESGRYYSLRNNNKAVIANVCLSSRKDFRNAVVAARKAQAGWSGKSAYNRSQILYRIAEMLESRSSEFINELILQGSSKEAAKREVTESIDLLIYYAGWCDKFVQVYSSVNPVASSHFNFSVPEPMGVVAAVSSEDSSLFSVVSVMTPIIAGGNTAVIIASENLPLCAVTFAEVLATSDVPSGVVNILTGSSKELLPFMISHMDVNAVAYCGDDKSVITEIRKGAADNLKRVVIKDSAESEGSPMEIMNFQEIKTTWHPVENIGAGGAGY